MRHAPGFSNASWFDAARHQMGGGAKTVNSTSSSGPSALQAPYLQGGYKVAADQLATPQSYFPGSTVVPFSGQTEQALGMQEQRALAGSPLMKQAQTNAQGSLSGQLNPALQGMIGQVQQQIRPGIDSQFAGAGRYGSGAHANAMASAATDAGTRLAYGDYQNAMQMAPGLAQQDYADIGQLASVGQVRENQAGANIQDQLARYNFAQQEPVDRLQRYMALIGGGNVGGTTTSSQPIFSNPMMQAAGLGLGGIGAAGSLFGQGGIWPQGNGFNSMFS